MTTVPGTRRSRPQRWFASALAAGAASALVLNRTTSHDTSAVVSERVAEAPHAVHLLVEAVSEGGLAVLAVLFATVAARRWRATRAWLAAAATGASVVAAYLVSEALKTVHAAPRPCWAQSAAQAVGGCPAAGDWSLPSNHAAIAAALGAAVLVLAPRLWPPVVALVLVVGAARVGLGVHYPHDVLDGFTVGAGVVLAVHGAVVLTTRRRARRQAARRSPAHIGGG